MTNTNRNTNFNTNTNNNTNNNNVSELGLNKLKSEIKIKDNFTFICIFHHFHDELQQKTYLFNSVENKKGSALLMFNFHYSQLINMWLKYNFIQIIQTI